MKYRCAFLIAGLAALLVVPLKANADLPTGQVVISPDQFMRNQAVGLPDTNSTDQSEPVSGMPFDQEQTVVIGKKGAQDNTTQFTVLTTQPISKGDTLLATFWTRGHDASGKKPASYAFYFQQSAPPWTGSASAGVVTNSDPKSWKRIDIPFTAAGDYPAGGAMACIHLSSQAQTIEIGGLKIQDFGKQVSTADLVDQIAQSNPLGKVDISINKSDRRQTILGFGGDFCQPRYGQTEAMDSVGDYNIAHLEVAQARVGIPLNYWTPQQGVFNDNAQAHAAFLQMKTLHDKGIPIIGTVWEGPAWMLPGKPEQSGRVLDPSMYGACINAIGKFLVTARDKYGVDVDYFSFNEANYGVNFLFTPDTIDQFVRQAGPVFVKLGLKTKFLVGDTTGGAPFPAYVQTLIHDPAVAQYLGPLAFHCWDALEVSDDAYSQIAAIGRSTGKPIYCTEGGWDSALWQRENAFPSWDNALHTAQAYSKTLRTSGASTIDYWTYEDNYPIVSEDGNHPYPVFNVIQQIGETFPKGSHIVGSTSSSSDIEEVVSVGPERGEMSAMIVDTSGAADVTVDGLPQGLAFAGIEMHDGGIVIHAAPPYFESAKGKITVSMPARSVMILTCRPSK